jgi:hypothetical protein
MKKHNLGLKLLIEQCSEIKKYLKIHCGFLSSCVQLRRLHRSIRTAGGIVALNPAIASKDIST